MKQLFKNIFYVTLPSILVLLLLLELVFRFVIPAANQPDYIFNESEKMLKFDAESNTSGVFSIGKLAELRSHWSINAQGWNSPYDYASAHTNKKRICVIGDSYIEALMVDIDKTYPFLLGQKLDGSSEVYAFGVSGSPFSQYLHMSRYVKQNFSPDVLVINLVHNDFDESLKQFCVYPYDKSIEVKNDSVAVEVEPEPYHYSTINRILKRSALVRYLVTNLKIEKVLRRFQTKMSDGGGGGAQNANISVNRAKDHEREIAVAFEYISSKLREENPGKRIIFVMDGSRQDIYNGTLNNCNVCFLNDLAGRCAAKNQIEFIDLNPVFDANYKIHHQKFNSDFDFHWDAYGHAIVADTLYKYITKT